MPLLHRKAILLIVFSTLVTVWQGGELAFSSEDDPWSLFVADNPGQWERRMSREGHVEYIFGDGFVPTFEFNPLALDDDPGPVDVPDTPKTDTEIVATNTNVFTFSALHVSDRLVTEATASQLAFSGMVSIQPKFGLRPYPNHSGPPFTWTLDLTLVLEMPGGVQELLVGVEIDPIAHCADLHPNGKTCSLYAVPFDIQWQSSDALAEGIVPVWATVDLIRHSQSGGSNSFHQSSIDYGDIVVDRSPPIIAWANLPARTTSPTVVPTLLHGDEFSPTIADSIRIHLNGQNVSWKFFVFEGAAEATQPIALRHGVNVFRASVMDAAGNRAEASFRVTAYTPAEIRTWSVAREAIDELKDVLGVGLPDVELGLERIEAEPILVGTSGTSAMQLGDATFRVRFAGVDLTRGRVSVQMPPDLAGLPGTPLTVLNSVAKLPSNPTLVQAAFPSSAAAELVVAQLGAVYTQVGNLAWRFDDQADTFRLVYDVDFIGGVEVIIPTGDSLGDPESTSISAPIKTATVDAVNGEIIEVMSAVDFEVSGDVSGPSPEPMPGFSQPALQFRPEISDGFISDEFTKLDPSRWSSFHAESPAPNVVDGDLLLDTGISDAGQPFKIVGLAFKAFEMPNHYRAKISTRIHEDTAGEFGIFVGTSDVIEDGDPAPGEFGGIWFDSQSGSHQCGVVQVNSDGNVSANSEAVAEPLPTSLTITFNYIEGTNALSVEIPELSCVETVYTDPIDGLRSFTILTLNMSPTGLAPNVESRSVVAIEWFESTFAKPFAYTANLSPYRIGQQDYDDGIGAGPAMLFIKTLQQGPVGIVADNTPVPANGETNYSLALVSAQSTYVSLITPLSKEEIEVLDGVVVDAYLRDFYVANGFGKDYTINMEAPPDTYITSRPPPSVQNDVVTIEFAASEPSSFECRLNGPPWFDCETPLTLEGLGAGLHDFSVRARSASGYVDPTPAVASWSLLLGAMPLIGESSVSLTYSTLPNLVPVGEEGWVYPDIYAADYFSDGGLLGFSIASGDVNGDGVLDAIGGMPGNGVARVVAIDGVSGSPISTIHGKAYFAGEQTLFGWAVTTADFDGDGYADIVVGDPVSTTVYVDHSTGTPVTHEISSAGAVYVFSGRTNELEYVLTGTEAAGFFGYSVATIADVTGNGTPDLLVQENLEDRLHIFDGATGIHQFTLGIEGCVILGFETSRLLPLADIDGRGLPDFAVGVPCEDIIDETTEEVTKNVGAIRVFAGEDGDLIWSVAGVEAFQSFATTLAPVGDLNNDGVVDIVANGGPEQTLVVVSGLDGSELLQLAGPVSAPILPDVPFELETGFGFSTAAAIGDIDDDGATDIMVLGGAPNHPNFSTDAISFGSVFAFSGKDGRLLFTVTSPVTAPVPSLEDVTSGDLPPGFVGAFQFFGVSLASAGDQDGDGFGEFYVGAPAASGLVKSGKIYQFRITQTNDAGYVASFSPFVSGGTVYNGMPPELVPETNVLVNSSGQIERVDITEDGTRLAFVNGDESYALALIRDVDGAYRTLMTNLTRDELLSLDLEVDQIDLYFERFYIANGPQHDYSIRYLGPETYIVEAPEARSNSVDAEFQFAANEPALFECFLDVGPWEPCDVIQSFQGLVEGEHTLLVRAIDSFGNVDPTPETHFWEIDRTPPNSTIISGPNSPSSNVVAIFDFGASELSTFECIIDGEEWYSCGSPQFLGPLEKGPHEFKVRATDLAGNVENAPASHFWVIDFLETTITSGPPDWTTELAASFTFLADVVDATFECRINLGSWYSCNSPASVLAPIGDNIFEVRARTAGGQVDATPAAWGWQVVGAGDGSGGAPPFFCFNPDGSPNPDHRSSVDEVGLVIDGPPYNLDLHLHARYLKDVGYYRCDDGRIELAGPYVDVRLGAEVDVFRQDSNQTFLDMGETVASVPTNENNIVTFVEGPQVLNSREYPSEDAEILDSFSDAANAYFLTDEIARFLENETAFQRQSSLPSWPKRVISLVDALDLADPNGYLNAFAYPGVSIDGECCAPLNMYLDEGTFMSTVRAGDKFIANKYSRGRSVVFHEFGHTILYDYEVYSGADASAGQDDGRFVPAVHEGFADYTQRFVRSAFPVADENEIPGLHPDRPNRELNGLRDCRNLLPDAPEPHHFSAFSSGNLDVWIDPFQNGVETAHRHAYGQAVCQSLARIEERLLQVYGAPLDTIFNLFVASASSFDTSKPEFKSYLDAMVSREIQRAYTAHLCAGLIPNGPPPEQLPCPPVDPDELRPRDHEIRGAFELHGMTHDDSGHAATIVFEAGEPMMVYESGGMIGTILTGGRNIMWEMRFSLDHDGFDNACHVTGDFFGQPVFTSLGLGDNPFIRTEVYWQRYPVPVDALVNDCFGDSPPTDPTRLYVELMTCNPESTGSDICRASTIARSTDIGSTQYVEFDF